VNGKKIIGGYPGGGPLFTLLQKLLFIAAINMFLQGKSWLNTLTGITR
jgi:hypothetical protein